MTEDSRRETPADLEESVVKDDLPRDPLRDKVEAWLRRDGAEPDDDVLEATLEDTRFLEKVERDLGGKAHPGAERSAAGPEAPRAVKTPPPSTTPDGHPRTPPDGTPTPEAVEGVHDLDAPGYYLNRELTWLNFNFRVLHEAEDPRTPLLERIKFIAIVSGNLDEFFMKRIGGLKQQVGAGVEDPTVDGHTPQEQIDESYELVRRLEERKRQILHGIVAELEDEGICIRAYQDLTHEQQAELRDRYLQNIYPLVTPQATDPAHPFPFVSNLSLNLLVTLHHPNNPTPGMARVKVPIGAGIPRLLQVEGERIFVPLESIMAHNLDLLFPGMEINGHDVFRVTRNANTERSEEQADDLLALIEDELKDRKFAPIVRLEVDAGMSPYLRGMLAAELGLDEQADVFESPGMLGMSDLMELVKLSGTDLHDPPHHAVDHPAFTTDRNIFHVIRDRGSLLLHHPYISFTSSVERFLREASRDPKVRAIKMALYRTSADTKAIQYLIDAARNGKQVAVVVELKARFDEEANIRWAARLEEVGIHVTYGVVGLKTHCKVILVLRQDYNGLKRYAHIGTGNYHAGTARLYSDVGLLTSDPDIGADLTELFNYLTTGYKPKRKYNRILPSPKICKQALLNRIHREVEHVKAGHTGLIQFKMNALEDVQVTRALYEASRAGVQVDLIIRDTCRLRPGIPGLSDNVRVVSVVGRFLEHSRIYYFQNLGDEEYYIGSADCMSRNLNSRVEVLAPVDDDEHKAELRFLLDTQLKDQRSAWEMLPDGSYVQRQPEPGSKAKGSQRALIDRHEKLRKKANRAKRRKIQGFTRRNVR